MRSVLFARHHLKVSGKRSVILSFALILFCLSFGLSSTSFAKARFGLVEVNGTQIYTEYSPAQDKKPTIIFVNGLTYSTRNWFWMAQPLRAQGYGVVLFDMKGMGTTLLSNFIPTEPINYQSQARDIKALLQKLKVPRPYNLVGLSYGGGILTAFASLYPKDVKNLILMAPYTEFLEAQKKWIRQQIEMTRALYPHNPASDEELTDFFIRKLVYTTYPMAEISSVENPYKLEGITRMVQGIRMYQPIEKAKEIPRNSLHLILAENDQYIPSAVFEKYWAAVPRSSRASRVIMKYSEHKMPEAHPQFSANLVKQILDGNPLFFDKKTVIANPLTLTFEQEK